MTVGEYIKAKFGVWGYDFPDDLAAVELSRVGISTEDLVDENTNLDRFFYNVLPEVLLRPKSVSEGGYSLSYDDAGMKAYYSMLAKRLGMADNLSSDRIIDISNQW